MSEQPVNTDRRQAQGDTARRFIIIALLFVLTALVGFGYVRKPAQPRFEYKLEEIQDANFAKEINELGSAGWELVFARRATSIADSANYELIFKRGIP